MSSGARHAGTSAGERFNELSHTWRRRFRRVWVAFFAVAAAFAVAGYLAPGQWKLYLGILAGGVLGVSMALRDTPPQYIESWRLGREGERRTERRLKRLAAAGWLVWHDLSWAGRANVDHVVIGNSGIFLVDSKNYNGTIEVHDGAIRVRWIEDPGDGWESRAIARGTKAASAALAERIAATCGLSPWVQPVVVVWGRFRSVSSRTAACASSTVMP
ncbi:MAG: NERD domain-containing protein [Candidatus Dormibacteraeota bacterium]|nr:NERD domain-containing protein [Candidatus Dormibacteraeota bacterium]